MKTKNNKELEIIRRLVGDATSEQLRYVDSFVTGEIGLFMPVGGACLYALTPEHSHPAYMFVLNFDDQTGVKLNGRTITARPGKIFCLSPGTAHQELPSDFTPRYIAILIGKSFFERQLSFYPVKRDICFDGEFHNITSNLVPLLNKFMIEADNSVPGCDAVLHGLGLEISHSIIRGIFDVKAVEDRITGRVEIGRVIEYIHAHMHTKMTIGNMAGIACMSPSHFSHVFKAETGKTPLDCLNEMRMRRVKKLLIAGDRSITEIALECGFGSPAYLTASFCKKYKITPSKFRTVNKQKQDF
ncbi:MAG: helix-turn-helix transcriptional regulator [Nitrospirae bacterium]|nr:helix-turn-helix transcriptional regulator [Nitrospirota bacterium]